MNLQHSWLYERSPIPWVLSDDATPPIIVLLGEAGLGKSTLVASLCSTKISLSGLSTREGLLATLSSAEASPSDSAVFIDALDECLLPRRELNDALVEFATRLAVRRVRLRLVCRAADWSQDLEARLSCICDCNAQHSAMVIYVLSPLSRSDVEAYAQDKGVVAPAAFVDAIIAAGLGAFAARPLTLPTLVDMYLKGGLPSSDVALFDRLLARLAEESSASRAEYQVPNEIIVHHRLEGARLIAAVLRLSRRLAVVERSTTAFDGDLVASEIYAELSAITPHREKKLLKEILGCGLFTSQDGIRFVPAHLTFVDRLTAAWLVERRASIDQIVALLTDIDHGELLAPLRSLAVQLAQLYGIFRQWLVDNEPECFASIDSEMLTASQRERAMQRLLVRLCENPERIDRIPLRPGNALDCPKIAETLATLIRQRNSSAAVREVVFRFAQRSDDAFIHNLSIGAALSSAEPYAVRAAAFRSLRSGALTETDRTRLWQLAKKSSTDDNVRGLVFRLLWPQWLSAAQLFPVLSRPTHEQQVGSYDYFLRRELVPFLSRPELPIALRWVAQWRHSSPENYAIRQLIQGICRLAWDAIADKVIADGLANAAKSTAFAHATLFGGNSDDSAALLNDAVRRRLYIAALIRAASKEVSSSDWRDLPTWFVEVFPLRTDDTLWFLDELITIRASSRTRAIYLACVSTLVEFRDIDASTMNGILDRVSRNPALKEALSWQVLGPWQLDDPRVKAERERFRILESTRQLDAARRWPIADRVKSQHECLSDFVARPVLKRWTALLLQLAADEFRHVYFLRLDPRRETGWTLLREADRDDLVQAAAKLLIGVSAVPRKRRVDGSAPFEVLALARAVFLVRELAPQRLLTLGVKQYAAITRVLFDYPEFDGEDVDSYRDLLRWLHMRAPAPCEDAILNLLDLHERKSDPIFGLNYLAEFDSPRFRNELLTRLPRFKRLGTIDAAWRCLLDADEQSAVDAAIATVNRAAGKLVGDLHAERAAIALRPAFATLWCSVFNPLFCREPSALTWWLAQEDHYNDLFNQVGVMQDTQLVEFLERIAEQPSHTGAQERPRARTRTSDPSRIEALAVRVLAVKGTAVAAQFLRRLADAQPRRTWLGREARDAAERYREFVGWQPPTPAELLGLLHPGRKLIRTSAELHLAIRDAFSDIAAGLQPKGTSSGHARWLWNDGTPPAHRNEGAISDYFKDQLDRLLRSYQIHTNREVQFSAPAGAGQGRKSDLLVEVVSESGMVGTVIVEVKGDWNKKVLTDLEDELVERYLRRTNLTEGVYVVAFTGYSKKRTVDALKDLLEAQARSFKDVNVSVVIIDIRLHPVA